MPIVDFRVRPPFGAFAGMDLYYDRSDVDPVVGSVFDMNVDDVPSRRERSMDLFMKEMDEAGIDVGVVMGRAAPERTPDRAPHLLSGTIPNSDVAGLVDTYPGRFVGFGGINGSDPAAAVQEIDRCVDLGFRGVAFDNPLSSPPMYDDDDRLMPIYEKVAASGLILSLTSSLYIGPDISYSEPIHVQRVALRFPELTIVVPHACYPWTTQMCAIATLCKNLYLIPDVYMNIPNMPGSEDWVQAANLGLGPRILYASTYPTRPLKQSVDYAAALPYLSTEIRDGILGENAVRILGL
jgi:predicted TIM-barrel fold metal-dependent hydrolase